MAKGRGNFTCQVNADYLPCKECFRSSRCIHTTAEFGPCLNDGYVCDFKPRLSDYITIRKGTKNEVVKYSPASSSNLPMYPSQDEKVCEYFDQLYRASAASHTIFNYPMFLGLQKILEPRKLLILDEAHLLESQIVEFRSISISRRRWSKYIPNLQIPHLGDDISSWINFLSDLNAMLRDRISILIEFVKGGGKKTAQAVDIRACNQELIKIRQDKERLESIIDEIRSSNDWIVSDILLDTHGEVAKVEFKPLSVADYCKKVFNKARTQAQA
jgi:ATP-dependent DNA helicase DinG